MVVKQKTAPVSAEPTEVKPIVVELVGYARYFWDGVMYLKGIRYVCETQDQANRLLQHENEGMRPFQLWAEKPKEDSKENPFQPVPTSTTPGTGAATVTPKGMELGTPEEEKELGLDKIDKQTTEL